MNDHIYIDEYELEELREEDRAKRRYEARLARNPDCRDPDHPGCTKCMEDDHDASTKSV